MSSARPLIGVSTSELREARTVRPLAQGEPRQHEIALGLTYPEAVEDTSRPFVVGVQWHAESLAHRPEHGALFRTFVAACAAYERSARSLAAVA